MLSSETSQVYNTCLDACPLSVRNVLGVYEALTSTSVSDQRNEIKRVAGNTLKSPATAGLPSKGTCMGDPEVMSQREAAASK